MKATAKTILSLGLLAVFTIPPFIFLWAALAAGLGIGESLAAMVAQYTAERQNLLVCSAIGLFPLALLAVGLWIGKRLAPEAQQAMALTGLLPILAVLVWVNRDFWPLFLPSRTYPGFPHGLGFVIGPLIFAPIGMLVGLLLGWWVARSRT